jgi:polyhydroxyalkanoate synthesis regulator phasin
MTEDTSDKKARGPLYDATRTILLAAVGAASLAQDEVNAFVDRMVERGEMAEADARKLVREVIDRREKMLHDHKAKGKAGAGEAAASKADIEALTARIAELTRQVEELKKEKAA